MEVKLIREKLYKNNELKLYELKNSNGMICEILNYGARIHKLLVKDIFDNLKNVIIGFEEIEDYIEKENPYFNATIGRVANRIENAKFKLNKTEYNLYKNNGENSLHGGKEGFDKKFWESSIENGKLKLYYSSMDMEEGYPGNLSVNVYFNLTDNNELEIEYEYKADKDTICNLTNHAYFNLSGDFSTGILDHILKINSSFISEVNQSLIPIKKMSVENSPFDFKTFKPIRKDINYDNLQLQYGNGYDHNFIFDNLNPNQSLVSVYSPLTQIKMNIFTDRPCVQFYTASGIDCATRQLPTKHCAFCLETQDYVNLINERDNQNAVCVKDKVYNTKTTYKFSLNNEEDDLDGKILVEELICYAKKFLYLDSLDEIYFRNLLLTQFNLVEPLDYKMDLSYIERLEVPDNLIGKIESYALRKNLTSLVNKSQFSAYIMGLLSPSPSKINQVFYDLKNKIDTLSATTFFYDLCVKNNYIQKTAIDKNLKWEVNDKNKKLEITINLSKPEKNNKDIAKLLTTKESSNYPKCVLCKENEGYKGSTKIQPRTNIRTVSLKMGGEDWFVQYSPYAYFEEHCIAINKNHTNMDITPSTLNKMFDFVNVFDNYFIGSNASLPYIGGSILNHEHFQGGKHLMPMHYATYKQTFKSEKYKNLTIGILDWYNSAIRLEGNNKEELIELGGKIINEWKNYENKKLMIINKSDGVLHNSLSPILRKTQNGYSLDFILRNNIQTKEYPEGYFHAHPEYHNIKREGIGLIEAMGLFILPARLQNQLSLVASILCGEINLDLKELDAPSHYLHIHRDMIVYLKENFECTNYSQAKRIVMGRVDVVCKNILLNTSVFKEENGYNDFVDFVKKVIK